MNPSNPFMIAIVVAAITITLLIVEIIPSSIQAQTPTASDLPMTTINETDSNVEILNKTIPAENATNIVPAVPMKYYSNYRE